MSKSKKFKVYFSPIGSRDPYNEEDKTLGSAISIFRGKRQIGRRH